MYLLVLPLLAGVALLLAAVLSLPGADAARNNQANAQLQQYQAFLYAGKAFFAVTPAPPVTTAYRWTTIRSAAPPSMLAAGIPPHWLAVRAPDGDWVACTEIAETTLAKLPALFPEATGAAGGIAPIQVVPPTSITFVLGTGGASEPGMPNYVVLGQTAAQAAASANLCSAN